MISLINHNIIITIIEIFTEEHEVGAILYTYSDSK